MLGKFDAQVAGTAAATDDRDARSAALVLMSEALARLDSDSNIPAVIGAHLQTAIDTLWTSGSPGSHSTRHH